MGTGGHEGSGLARGAVGSARVIAFGASNVAPAGSVVAGLVVVVSYAGFASPLVVLIAFASSLCCASSIAEFARRLPSAGSLYTYGSRGLGRTGGFLVGWMMVFAYVVYVPAGIALTSAYMANLLAGALHVAVSARALFVVIVGVVALTAYLGIKTSSSMDLVLVVGEVAIIGALAVTILVSVGPADYSAAVLSPAASPNGQLTDITNATIYGITAFAGFEAATALGEEARNTRRSIPASTIGVVVATGIFYLLVVLAEMFGVGRQGIPGFVRQGNPLGYLTSRYWSPSAIWAVELVVVLAGLGFVIATFNVAIRVLFAMGRERVLPGALARLSRRRTPIVSIACVAAFALVLGMPLTYRYGGARTFSYIAGAGGLSVVLVYLAVNIAVIGAFRAGFRDEFSPWRHLIVPATASVLFLFPLWGILHPRAHQIADLLHFTALGWLAVGVIVAVILRTRRPESFGSLGRVFVPPDEAR
ncbi:MAG TPA: APC family permease [Streptosporangiaceae bacterium]|nr:APC family permease [Streptosporangiaceae bacterium]